MKTALSTDIQAQLTDDGQAFVDHVRDLSEAQSLQHLADKWSVADVMQHLYLSARPVARLMTGPREVFGQWGSPETAPRSYDDIAAAYYAVLAKGVKAPMSMSPRHEDMQVDIQVLIGRFTGVYQTLVEDIDNWTDEELDTYCMPHPVLDKLTVREMLYFTSIHTQHHLRLLI